MASNQRIGKTATTVERTENGSVRVIYHSTPVVEVTADGTVTLNNGGWRTNTTKARMNQTANQFGLGCWGRIGIGPMLNASRSTAGR